MDGSQTTHAALPHHKGKPCRPNSMVSLSRTPGCPAKRLSPNQIALHHLRGGDLRQIWHTMKQIPRIQGVSNSFYIFSDVF
jgi:hypothetical protein